MAGNMVGRVLNDRYKITERVGLGGMAEVYRAQDNVLGRIVAVKVMLPQYAADPTFTQRFRQEAASAAKLQSPYIVSIYDWGLDDDTYYIVMEFLRGTDLKTAIKERGTINQRKAAEIGSQVAQALSVAHAANIIHRDIKPQNIMIQPDGNIKVMDFGIARAGDAGLSQTSTVLGTAHYVSPEQAQGKELTPASDIYSLGIVLYESITGKLPFDGTDAVSVAVKQVNEIPDPPSAHNPNIDPTLEAIIMKAMEKDPERRFQSASEMRHALNDWLAGRPVHVGDLSNMKTQVMGAGVPVMEGGSTAVLPIAADNQSNNVKGFHAEDSNEKKSKRGPIIASVIVVLAIIAIAIGVFAMNNQGEMATVPDVTNQPVETARAMIENAGFVVGNETQVYNSDIQEGNVVSTNPTANSQARKGSTVNLNVSRGTEQVTVPDLKNQTSDEAMRTLSNLGLTGQIGDPVYSDEVDKDRVASQDTAAGTSVNKGDTVVIHLSQGPEQVNVPNVQGINFESARDRLESAGFTVTLQWIDDNTATNIVIRQSVTGTAEKGTNITLTISNGPKQQQTTDNNTPNEGDTTEGDDQNANQNDGNNQ